MQAKMLDFDVEAAEDAPLLAFHHAFSELDFAMPSRERFHVELKPGETTFVSWKKLLKDHQKSRFPFPLSEAPSGAQPALEARIASQVAKERDLSHPLNRFSSVIERIERLYQGDDSSNDLNDCIDNDKYDTQDSFIDDTELDNYFSVDNAKLKHEGFFVNRGKLEQEAELLPLAVDGAKNIKRNILKKRSVGRQDVSKESMSESRVKAVAKFPGTSASFSSFLDKNSSKTMEGKETKSLLFGQIVRRDVKHVKRDLADGDSTKEATRSQMDGKQLLDIKTVRTEKMDCISKENTKERMHEVPNVNVPSKTDAMIYLKHREASTIGGAKMKVVQKATKFGDFKQTLVVAKRLPRLTGEIVSPPCTALEKAILDLEIEVAEVCPPLLVAQEPEHCKRNYLPRDIKQKLAKVARLAVKQGGSTDKLIKRLIGILGHMVHVSTLKRKLKAMMGLCLSAMQEKEDRLQAMKREVAEMVESRVCRLQQDVCPLKGVQPLSSCFEKSSKSGGYQWDHATEDKICDLCEQCIEGVDENKGSHLRKLYAELIELWPDGWMNNLGIKLAVHRAKQRRKMHCKVQKTTNTRKRKLLTAKPKVENQDDDGVTLLQLVTKDRPSLGQKLKTLDISKRDRENNR